MGGEFAMSWYEFTPGIQRRFSNIDWRILNSDVACRKTRLSAVDMVRWSGVMGKR